ncbi:uncharacterized protein [Macrobrachium rosenbergii]|uniref:uncharacterized protein n=1 Tax=Macrobrachium rosenbergii TaxID=79674 RepID=UPI0034D41347
MILRVSKSGRRAEGTMGCHKKRGIAVGLLMCRLTLLNALQMPSAGVVEERPMIWKDFTASRYHELKCLPEVEVSDEDPDIQWIKPEKSEFTTKSWRNKNTLSSDAVRRADAGTSRALRRFSNGTRISQTFSVCVTLSTSAETKPGGGTISDETYAPEGHSIALECKASVGTPRCVNPFKYTLTWSKELLEQGSLELLTSSEGMNITEPQITEDGILYGRLIVKKVSSAHYGTFLCNITNEIGSLVQEVNVTDRVPLKLLWERQLWVVCAVIICITLVVSLLQVVESQPFDDRRRNTLRRADSAWAFILDAGVEGSSPETRETIPL